MSNILILTIFTTLIISVVQFIANDFLGMGSLPVPNWLARIFYACNVCMSHVYTISAGLLFSYPLWQIAASWLLVIGANYIINRISYD